MIRRSDQSVIEKVTLEQRCGKRAGASLGPSAERLARP